MTSKTTELNLIGDISFKVIKEEKGNIFGVCSVNKVFLSNFAYNYLKANRNSGQLNVEHYKSLVIHQLTKYLSEKLLPSVKDLKDIKLKLPNGFGIYSDSVEIETLLETSLPAPDLNIDNFTLKQYAVKELSEEDTLKVKDHFLESNSVLTDSSEPIQMGDVLRVAWKWRLDDKDEWTEDGNSGNTLITLGINPRLEPNLENELVGKCKGDFVEQTVTMPREINENSVNQAFAKYIKQIVKFAGKSIFLRLDIVDVQKPMKPEINEELLKKYQFESEADLDAKIKENIQNYINEQNRRVAYDEIMDFLRTFPTVHRDNEVKMYREYMIEVYARNLGLPPNNQGVYDLNSNEFQSQLMEKIKTTFPDWKYQSFEEFLAQAENVGKKIMAGDLMFDKLTEFLKIPENEAYDNFSKEWKLLTPEKQKSINKDKSQMAQFLNDAKFKFIMAKFIDYLTAEGKVETIELDSLNEFDKVTNSILDDACHTKYFK